MSNLTQLTAISPELTYQIVVNDNKRLDHSELHNGTDITVDLSVSSKEVLVRPWLIFSFKIGQESEIVKHSIGEGISVSEVQDRSILASLTLLASDLTVPVTATSNVAYYRFILVTGALSAERQTVMEEGQFVISEDVAPVDLTLIPSREFLGQPGFFLTGSFPLAGISGSASVAEEVIPVNINLSSSATGEGNGVWVTRLASSDIIDVEFPQRTLLLGLPRYLVVANELIISYLSDHDGDTATITRSGGTSFTVQL